MSALGRGCQPSILVAFVCPLCTMRALWQVGLTRVAVTHYFSLGDWGHSLPSLCCFVQLILSLNLYLALDLSRSQCMLPLCHMVSYVNCWLVANGYSNYTLRLLAMAICLVMLVTRNCISKSKSDESNKIDGEPWVSDMQQAKPDFDWNIQMALRSICTFDLVPAQSI